MNKIQDNKRYLVYKNTVYVPSILVDGTDIWAPLEKSTIKLSKQEIANGADKITINYITEEYAKELIGQGVANSHKQIVGTVYVADMAEAMKDMQAYNSGQTFALVDLNGNTVLYGKSIAKIGDVIIISKKPGSPSSFKTEEAVIMANKDATLLTSNNAGTIQLNNLNGKKMTDTTTLETVTDEIVVKGTLDSEITGVQNAIQVLHNEVGGQNQQLSSLNSEFSFLDGKVTVNTANIANDEGRITALEKSAATSNNLWLPTAPTTGLVFPGTGDTRTMDMSQMVGDDGKFSFIEGKDSFTITIRNKKNGDTDTEQVVVSKAGTTDHKNGFSLKKSSDDIDFSIDANGLATLHKAAGTISLDDVEFIRAFQHKAGISSTAVTQAAFAAEKALMLTALHEKQAKIDNLLTTNSKSLVGGINELDSREQTNNHNIDALNTRKVDNSNTNLDSMDGTTAAKTLASKSYVDNKISPKADKTYVNSMFDTSMKITFDDGSTGTYKINSGSATHIAAHTKGTVADEPNGIKVGKLEIKVNPTDGETYYYIDGVRKGKVGV